MTIRRSGRALVSALTILAASVLQSGCGRSQARITVEPSTRHQTIDGWEATLTAEDADPFTAAIPDAVPQMLRRAVDEVGINRVRLEIRSGAEGGNGAYTRYRTKQISYDQWRPIRYVTVNDNADPNVINWAGFDFSEMDEDVELAILPLQKLMAARGERLAINVTYVAFTQQIVSGEYIHTDPEEYAEFVLATYLHLRDKYGIVPDSWEIILEPDNENPHWRDGRMIGRAIVASARRLQAAGFTPRFIAPSVKDMRAAARYFEGIASVPGAVDHMVEFAYHRYGGADRPLLLPAIRKRAEEHGLKTSMLELWFGWGGRSVLREDLTVGNVSAWQGRPIWDLFSVDKEAAGGPRLVLNPDVRTNLQYFRYVRAGAVRIGARSSARAMGATAFMNPNGAYAVVVNANEAGEVQIEGLPPGRYAVSWGTEGENRRVPGEQAVEAGGAVTAEIPEPGVLTVYDARLDGPPVGP